MQKQQNKFESLYKTFVIINKKRGSGAQTIQIFAIAGLYGIKFYDFQGLFTALRMHLNSKYLFTKPQDIYLNYLTCLAALLYNQRIWRDKKQYSIVILYGFLKFTKKMLNKNDLKLNMDLLEYITQDPKKNYEIEKQLENAGFNPYQYQKSMNQAFQYRFYQNQIPEKYVPIKFFQRDQQYSFFIDIYRFYRGSNSSQDQKMLMLTPYQRQRVNLMDQQLQNQKKALQKQKWQNYKKQSQQIYKKGYEVFKNIKDKVFGQKKQQSKKSKQFKSIQYNSKKSSQQFKTIQQKPKKKRFSFQASYSSMKGPNYLPSQSIILRSLRRQKSFQSSFFQMPPLDQISFYNDFRVPTQQAMSIQQQQDPSNLDLIGLPKQFSFQMNIKNQNQKSFQLQKILQQIDNQKKQKSEKKSLNIQMRERERRQPRRQQMAQGMQVQGENPVIPQIQPPGQQMYPQAQNIANVWANTRPKQIQISNRDKTYKMYGFQPIEKRQASTLRRQAAYKDLSGIQRLFKESQTSVGKNLFMFPQWVNRNQVLSRQNQGKKIKFDRIYERLKNKEDQGLKLMASVPQSKIQWNQQKQSWTGPGVIDKIYQQKTGIPSDKTLQRAQKNRSILNQAADQKMVRSNMPAIVKMIIDANQQLSTAGIGPKRNGGIPLYAGRWLDPQTGAIKMFPKASQKMLNPLSRGQKLAYLQARILNKWNQFVDTVQSYSDTAKISQQKYKNRVINKIKSLQNSQAVISRAFKKILYQMQQYQIGNTLSNIGRQQFWSWIDQSGGDFVALMKKTIQYSKKKDWTGFMTQASPLLQQYVNQLPLQFQTVKQATAVARVYSYLASLFDPRYYNQLRLGGILAKIQTIPLNIPPDQFIRVQQNLRKARLQILQLLKKDSINPQKWKQLNMPASTTQSYQNVRNLRNIINTPITRQIQVAEDSLSKNIKGSLAQPYKYDASLTTTQKMYLNLIAPYNKDIQKVRQILLSYNGDLPSYNQFARQVKQAGITASQPFVRQIEQQ